MIQLVKHFLRRARPMNALIACSFSIMMYLGILYVMPMGLQLSGMPIMMILMCGMILPALTMEAEEFDLSLPVRRRTLYLAKNLAALLLTVIVAAPICAAALAVAAIQGDMRQALRFWPIITLCFITAPLIVSPLLRVLARHTSLLLARMIGMAPMIVIYVLLTLALDGRIPRFLPAVVAVLAAALAWFLGGRQFERYELVPGGDAGTAQAAAARPGRMDRLSPMVRVLAHAVWLNEWYPVQVVLAAGTCFILTAMLLSNSFGPVLLIASSMASVGFSGLIFILFRESIQTLATFVPRRTILRSVLGPFAATPLLIGCVAAIAQGSANMIVRGLATALVIVGATWIWLPSAREYRWPFLYLLRSGFLISIFLVYVCVLAVKGGMTSPFVAPWVDSNPVLLSCGIMLAIALLWWRCERKFRHFEPFVLPIIFYRAA